MVKDFMDKTVQKKKIEIEIEKKIEIYHFSREPTRKIKCA